MGRDNFSRTYRNHLLMLNAESVRRRWPSDFNDSNAHYICENCGWVNSDATIFEIDHILPCARGGTANRVSEEEQRRIAAGDVAQLYITGVNSMVLCRGCNRAKSDGEFIPDGRGYAHRSPWRERDRNPDHIFSGGPLA